MKAEELFFRHFRSSGWLSYFRASTMRSFGGTNSTRWRPRGFDERVGSHRVEIDVFLLGHLYYYSAFRQLEACHTNIISSGPCSGNQLLTLNSRHLLHETLYTFSTCSRSKHFDNRFSRILNLAWFDTNLRCCNSTFREQNTGIKTPSCAWPC